MDDTKIKFRIIPKKGDMSGWINSILVLILIILVIFAWVEGQFIKNTTYIVDKCGNNIEGQWNVNDKATEVNLLDCVNRGNCDEYKEYV